MYRRGWAGCRRLCHEIDRDITQLKITVPKTTCREANLGDPWDSPIRRCRRNKPYIEMVAIVTVTFVCVGIIREDGETKKEEQKKSYPKSVPLLREQLAISAKLKLGSPLLVGHYFLRSCNRVIVKDFF
jgi:hypothetical protein